MGEAATPASDRYALAVVAYELLTGAALHRRALRRPGPGARRGRAAARLRASAALPRAVDRVLERGLAKDPDDRWPSAAAFVDRARATRSRGRRGGGRPGPAAHRTPGAARRGGRAAARRGPPRPARRVPARRGAAGTAALVALGGAARSPSWRRRPLGGSGDGGGDGDERATPTHRHRDRHGGEDGEARGDARGDRDPEPTPEDGDPGTHAEPATRAAGTGTAAGAAAGWATTRRPCSSRPQPQRGRRSVAPPLAGKAVQRCEGSPRVWAPAPTQCASYGPRAAGRRRPGDRRPGARGAPPALPRRPSARRSQQELARARRRGR